MSSGEGGRRGRGPGRACILRNPYPIGNRDGSAIVSTFRRSVRGVVPSRRVTPRRGWRFPVASLPAQGMLSRGSTVSLQGVAL